MATEPIEPCPLGRPHRERDDPPNAATAWAFQFHETARNLFSFAHLPTTESFLATLEILKSQVHLCEQALEKENS